VAGKKLSKKHSSVRIFELPAYPFGKLSGRLCSDEYSRVKLPARAAHTLEGVLRADGWENVRTINPVFHGDNGELTTENWSEGINADYLLIGCITRTALQTLEFTKKLKTINPGQIAILGGHHPTFMTQEVFENKGDVVVLREGEKTVLEVMNRALEDRYELGDIKGIVFRNQNGEIIRTKRRKFLTPEGLSEVPLPYYDEITRRKASVAVVEMTRGCPNSCDFCDVTQFNGGIYRRRSIESSINRFRQAQEMGKRTVFITDDNIVGDLDNKDERVVRASIDYFVELSYALKEHGLDKTFNIAQITAAGARHPEVINALKRIGVDRVCVGLESRNPATLECLGKPYSAQENDDAVKTYRDAGLLVLGMMMIGPDDGKEYLRELSDWSVKNLDFAQFFSAGHLPGTEFEKQMRAENRIISDDYYLRDGHHVIIYPNEITPYEQQLGVINLYNEFYSVKNSFKRLLSSPHKRVSFEILLYTFLGGVRKVSKSEQMKEHLKLLEGVSRKYPDYEAFANRGNREGQTSDLVLIA
jgi:radical SAM superfamily enzyme YgiQ (UPF0313 family)